ncbi:MAG: hypothetical protein M3P26_15840 [Gemmatimonadota bacterium]|nr:hypothetical protein [Gemmatimonadota bacterium]
MPLIPTPVYVNLLGVESYGLIGFYLLWIAILGIIDIGASAVTSREITWLNARSDERPMIPTLLRSVGLVYWAIVVLAGGAVLAGASSPSVERDRDTLLRRVGADRRPVVTCVLRERGSVTPARDIRAMAGDWGG